LVIVEPRRDVDECVLHHVGCVEPPVRPRIEPELDHPAQAVAIPRQQFDRRLAVTPLGPLH
jgi:hypothetical protein